MLVLDSSAWIEWLADTAVAKDIEPFMQTLARLVVPTIVQLEVAKWLIRERTEDEAHEFIALTQKCDVVALTTPISVNAAYLCRRHKLATADAIIYATALYAEASVLTCDAHFKDLPGVTYLEKQA